jgi:indolepyruvate ferredoxin oxidoreductase alpha subunit
MEVGSAAAASGLRTMVTMKQVGLNVAADPLMTLAYVGVEAGMVIVNADDPYLFSSQNEQDNRQYARLAGIPLLEPTNAQELKDVATMAFDLSEKLKLPVLLRTTTRLNHIRGKVELGKLKPVKTKGRFKKNPAQWVTMPAHSRVLHQHLLEKISTGTGNRGILGVQRNHRQGEMGNCRQWRELQLCDGCRIGSGHFR